MSKITRTGMAAGVCLGLAALAGCGRHSHSDFSLVVPVGEQPPPQPVYVQQPPPEPDYYYVDAPPPQPIYEQPPPPPGVGFIWIGGYWDHDAGGYHWHRGYYDHDRPGHRYYAPHFEQRGGRWQRVPGGWR